MSALSTVITQSWGSGYTDLTRATCQNDTLEVLGIWFACIIVSISVCSTVIVWLSFFSQSLRPTVRFTEEQLWSLWLRHNPGEFSWWFVAPFIYVFLLLIKSEDVHLVLDSINEARVSPVLTGAPAVSFMIDALSTSTVRSIGQLYVKCDLQRDTTQVKFTPDLMSTQK